MKKSQLTYTNRLLEATDSETLQKWKNIKSWVKSNFNETELTSDSIRIIGIEPGYDAVIFDNGSGYVVSTEQNTSPVHSDWSFENGKFKIGDSDYTPGSTEYQTRSVEREKMSQVDRWEVIDYIQIILDFLGFIPGFGDILDLINALIYFAREKYIDGALSLIAIIPVVGSVMKFSLKGAFKAAGTPFSKMMIKSALKGDTKAWQKFLTQLLESGKITKDQLSKMAAYGDRTAELLNMGKGALRKHEKTFKSMGIDADILYKQFDEWQAFTKNFYKTEGAVKSSKWYDTPANIAKDIKKWSKEKPIGKFVTGVIKLPFKAADSVANIVTLGAWDLSKKTLKFVFGISPGSVSKLSKGMPVIFARKLEANSELAAKMMKVNDRIPSSLYQYLPNLSSYQKIMTNTPSKSLGKLSKKMRKKYGKNIPAATSTTRNLENISTADLHTLLRELNQTNKKAYKEVIQQISNQSAITGNIYYRQFVLNDLQTAYNVARPGAVFKGTVQGEPGSSAIVNFFKEMKWGVKSWDVVSNEVQDVAERFGLDETDDPNGVVIPLLYQGIMWMSGDALRSESNTTTDVQSQIDPNSVLANDEISQLKNLYDTTPGTPTDKLTAVKDSGLDELGLWAFEKIMGL